MVKRQVEHDTMIQTLTTLDRANVAGGRRICICVNEKEERYVGMADFGERPVNSVAYAMVCCCNNYGGTIPVRYEVWTTPNGERGTGIAKLEFNGTCTRDACQPVDL